MSERIFEGSLGAGVALAALLLLAPAVLVVPARAGSAGEPIWIHDTDLAIRHLETADLDADGIPDVIAGEYDAYYYGEPSLVRAVNGADGTTLWSYSLLDGVRSLTIGDVSGDGVMDAIAGASYNTSGAPDGRIHAIDGATGTALWTYFTGSTNQDVCAATFDGDSHADVAAACFDGAVYAIDGATGALRWSTGFGSLWVNAVAAGDANGDGVDDVGFAHEYLAGYSNFLGVLDGTDGSALWQLTVPYVPLDVLMEDIDADGLPEAVFGCVDGADTGHLYVRDALTGALEWDYDLGHLDHVNGDIRLAAHDIDDDGDLDLIVGTAIGTYEMFAFDGGAAVPMWISGILDGSVRDIAFGDVTGDGNLNIVASTYDRVQVLEAGDGTKTWYYGVAGTVYGVGVGDFDGDSVTDVAVGGGADFSGIPPNPGKSIWALRTVESPLLWEYNFGQYGNAMGIADLNGDPSMDVVTVSSLDDKLTAIDGATGSELWSWVGTENLYAVATGDLDNDGQVDVAAAGNDDRVTAVRGSDGTVMWQFTTPVAQIYRKCLQATDLNGDGAVDVIAGSDDNTIYALDGPTGGVLWTALFGGDVEEVELAQMNGTGPLDVVAAIGWSGNKAVVLDGADGTLLWEYAQSTDYARHVEVLDANGDGVPDIAIGVPKMGATPGRIILVDGSSHTALWTVTPFLLSSDYALAHGDLDGDGFEDVVAAGNYDDRAVHALDGASGVELWSNPMGDEVNVVRAADVNGDGRTEVIAGSDDQSVYVLDGTTGGVLWTQSTVGDVMDLRIGDISGDGGPNISCVTFGFDGVAYAFKGLGLPTVYVDNEDPQFLIYRGSWTSKAYPSAHGGTFVFSRKGAGENWAVWRIDNLAGEPFITPGTYDVYTWKFEHPKMNKMATDAPFKVFHRNGASGWIRLDQSQPGDEWQLLGTFEFDNGSPQGIVVTNNADGVVIADAIRLVPR